jgi:integrase
MSVYKPTKGHFWHFDFVLKGRRYNGSTGATTRSKAERVEAAKRVAAATGELDRRSIEVETLDQAATAWWKTKGHLRTADELLARASLAVELVGPGKRVNEVSFTDVQRAVQARRGQTRSGGGLIKNATINRDIIATLRPIIKFARRRLNDGVAAPISFPEIDWGALTLPEPKPNARDFKPSEIDAVLLALPTDMHDFARFQARYGLRLNEMIKLKLTDIDLEGRRIWIRERKGGDDHCLPLVATDAVMLATRVGQAKKAKLDTPWFRAEAGKLVPITYWHAQRRLRLAMSASGLRASHGARGSHDLRHHAGMQMLRQSKNLRTTQKLLGHASITSTLVYAHALEDDLRTALDELSRPAPEPAVSIEANKSQNPLPSKENARSAKGS